MNDNGTKPGMEIEIGQDALVIRTAMQRTPGHWWAERSSGERLWYEVRQNDAGEWEYVKR